MRDGRPVPAASGGGMSANRRNLLSGRRFASSLSLRARLSLALALAAALPLLLALGVTTIQQRRALRAEALLRQESQAQALARGVADYVNLHRASLVALASMPGLFDMPQSAQKAEMRAFVGAYPDMLSYALYDADGNVIVRSDELTSTVPVRGYPVYEQARATGRPSLDILISPVFHRPVFGFGAPIFDAQGRFAGLVTAALPSNQMADFLSQQDAGQGSEIYLVDDRGRALAHPDPSIQAAFVDLSSEAPVASLLSSPSAAGSLNFAAPGGNVFVGYARVPGLNWAVVVQRPEAQALAGVRASNLWAIAILLACLALTVMAGIILAGLVTAPLQALMGAVREVAAEQGPVLIAENSRVITQAYGVQQMVVPEIGELAMAFGEMRARLALRTAEREAAERSLRSANEQLRQAAEKLEARVAERTAELSQANTSLRAALAALGQSEERYRRLVEWAPVALMVHSAGRIVYANAAAAALLGAAGPDELLDVPMLRLVHPDYREIVAERVRKNVDQGESTPPLEEKMLRLDGTIVDVAAAAVPISFQGNPAVQLVLLDITARVEAEKLREAALAEREQARIELEVRVEERTASLKQTTEELSRREASLREALASLASANIELSKRQEELQRQGERLRILYEIDQAILAARSPAEIAQAALDGLRRALPCERGSVLMFEGESGVARFLAVSGAEVPGLQAGNTFPMGAWAVPEELLRGEVRRVEDLAAETDPSALRDALIADGFRGRIQAPLRLAGEVIGVLSLVSRAPSALSQDASEIAAQIALSLAVAIQNARLDEGVAQREAALSIMAEKLQASHRELQALSRRLVEVQENERRAVALELHDEAGQALTTLMIGLGLLEREAGEPQAVRTRVAELKATTDNVLEELHTLAVNLRPASLDRLGLFPALKQYVEQFRRQTGLQVALEAVGLRGERRGSGEGGASTEWPAPPERFAPEVETTVYRVVQEALTNVVRHAGASYAGVLIERRRDALIAIVEDNGVGFDVEGATARLEPAKGERLGLLGMRERAEMVGGTLTIESTPGHGTTVFVEVPLE